MTKGEAYVKGVETAREGFALIASVSGGNRDDLLTALIGSKAASKGLQELMRPRNLCRTLVVASVAAKQRRDLSIGTVENVIDAFLSTLVELSEPFEAEGEAEQ